MSTHMDKPGSMEMIAPYLYAKVSLWVQANLHFILGVSFSPAPTAPISLDYEKALWIKPLGISSLGHAGLVSSSLSASVWRTFYHLSLSLDAFTLPSEASGSKPRLCIKNSLSPVLIPSANKNDCFITHLIVLFCCKWEKYCFSY